MQSLEAGQHAFDWIKGLMHGTDSNSDEEYQLVEQPLSNSISHVIAQRIYIRFAAFIAINAACNLMYSNITPTYWYKRDLDLSDRKSLADSLAFALPKFFETCFLGDDSESDQQAVQEFAKLFCNFCVPSVDQQYDEQGAVSGFTITTDIGGAYAHKVFSIPTVEALLQAHFPEDGATLTGATGTDMFVPRITLKRTTPIVKVFIFNQNTSHLSIQQVYKVLTDEDVLLKDQNSFVMWYRVTVEVASFSCLLLSFISKSLANQVVDASGCKLLSEGVGDILTTICFRPPTGEGGPELREEYLKKAQNACLVKYEKDSSLSETDTAGLICQGTTDRKTRAMCDCLYAHLGPVLEGNVAGASRCFSVGCSDPTFREGFALNRANCEQHCSVAYEWLYSGDPARQLSFPDKFNYDRFEDICKQTIIDNEQHIAYPLIVLFGYMFGTVAVLLLVKVIYSKKLRAMRPVVRWTFVVVTIALIVAGLFVSPWLLSGELVCTNNGAVEAECRSKVLGTKVFRELCFGQKAKVYCECNSPGDVCGEYNDGICSKSRKCMDYLRRYGVVQVEKKNTNTFRASCIIAAAIPCSVAIGWHYNTRWAVAVAVLVTVVALILSFYVRDMITVSAPLERAFPRLPLTVTIDNEWKTWTLYTKTPVYDSTTGWSFEGTPRCYIDGTWDETRSSFPDDFTAAGKKYNRGIYLTDGDNTYLLIYAPGINFDYDTLLSQCWQSGSIFSFSWVVCSFPVPFMPCTRS